MSTSSRDQMLCDLTLESRKSRLMAAAMIVGGIAVVATPLLVGAMREESTLPPVTYMIAATAASVSRVKQASTSDIAPPPVQLQIADQGAEQKTPRNARQNEEEQTQTALPAAEPVTVATDTSTSEPPPPSEGRKEDTAEHESARDNAIDRFESVTPVESGAQDGAQDGVQAPAYSLVSRADYDYLFERHAVLLADDRKLTVYVGKSLRPRPRHQDLWIIGVDGLPGYSRRMVPLPCTSATEELIQRVREAFPHLGEETRLFLAVPNSLDHEILEAQETYLRARGLPLRSQLVTEGRFVGTSRFGRGSRGLEITRLLDHDGRPIDSAALESIIQSEKEQRQGAHG